MISVQCDTAGGIGGSRLVGNSFVSSFNFEEQNTRRHQTLKECVLTVTKVVTMEQPGSHAARAPAWMSPSIASAKNQFQPTSHIVPGRSYVQQAQREGHSGHDHRCTESESKAFLVSDTRGGDGQAADLFYRLSPACLSPWKDSKQRRVIVSSARS